MALEIILEVRDDIDKLRDSGPMPAMPANNIRTDGHSLLPAKV